MRQCYIDNGHHGCDGQRNNKGRIRYGCWACPWLDAGGGEAGGQGGADTVLRDERGDKGHKATDSEAGQVSGGAAPGIRYGEGDKAGWDDRKH